MSSFYTLISTTTLLYSSIALSKITDDDKCNWIIPYEKQHSHKNFHTVTGTNGEKWIYVYKQDDPWITSYKGYAYINSRHSREYGYPLIYTSGPILKESFPRIKVLLSGCLEYYIGKTLDPSKYRQIKEVLDTISLTLHQHNIKHPKRVTKWSLSKFIIKQGRATLFVIMRDRPDRFFGNILSGSAAVLSGGLALFSGGIRRRLTCRTHTYQVENFRTKVNDPLKKAKKFVEKVLPVAI